MPYIGNKYEIGDHNNSWKTLDDISSYVATFDGSATNAVSTTNNTIRVPEHRFIQGQRVTYSNGGGGNIGGLTSGTAYYVSFDTNNTLKLATSLVNANNNSVVNLSAVGSGSSHTLTAAFDGVNKKFKITYSGGRSSRFTSATQLSIAINNILQRPNDTTTFTDGFRISDNEKIEFNVAPVAADIFWGSILSASLPTFDISDNKLDNFTGDGSTTDFTLSHIPVNNEGIIVTINGVIQHPTDKNGTRAYSLDASVLVFTAAPANGDEIQVRHIGFAGATSGNVTGFYGRTGNVTLSSSADNAIVGVITATSFSGPIVAGAGTSDIVAGILTVTKAHVGGGTTWGEDLVVTGNARVTGILTVGTNSVTISQNDVNITGVTTASNFKTGTSNLHSAGVEVAGVNVLGADTPIGLGATIYNSGAAVFTGIVTASKLNVTDISTFTGNIDANGMLDVDGPTHLDYVSISGVTTHSDTVHIIDDKVLMFGSGGDSTIEYDENGTDQLTIAGAVTRFTNTTQSTSKDTGSVILEGGLGVEKNLFVGGNVTAVDGTFSGNVSVGGTLTYEDVTNVDAVGLVTAREGIFLPDSKTIKLGNTSSSPDFTIQHNGTNSVINNTTGSLLFQNNGSSSVWINNNGVIYTNNDLFVQTANGNNIFMDKSDNSIRLGDSVTQYLGSNNDMWIMHNGSTGYLHNVTGGLYIRNEEANGHVYIQGKSGENSIICKYDGAVELYDNDIKTFQTDANGIRVLGPDGGVGQIELFADRGDDNADKWRLQATASGSNFSIQNYVNGSWETSVKATGNSHTELYHGDDIRFRTNGDGAEFFDSDNNCNVYFTCNGTRRGYLFVDSTNGGKIGFMDPQNHWLISGTKNSSVDLYHDNTLRLQTSSTGIEVTGEVASSQDYPKYRPTLDFNFTAVKKLDSRFTYSRNGVASYIDEYGYLKFVGDNTPRFDHDPDTGECLGLLIEDSRTNMFHNNGGTGAPGEEPSTGANLGNAPTQSIVNDVILPTGKTGSVRRVVYHSGGNSGLRWGWTSGGSANNPYSASVWARAVSGTASLTIDVNDQDNNTYTLTTEWVRMKSTGTTSNAYRFMDLMGGASADVYIWGYQLEQNDHVSSYMPNNNARGTETLTIEGEEFSDFYNQNEGTLVLSASYTEDNRASAIVVIDDTSNESEYTEVGYRAGGGGSGAVASYIRTDAGNDQYYKQYTSSATQGNEFKVALAYKDNDYASSVNGQTVDTDTSGTTSKVYDRLRFSDVDTVGVQGSGYYRRFMYYPKRLPNNQVVTLTS